MSHNLNPSAALSSVRSNEMLANSEIEDKNLLKKIKKVLYNRDSNNEHPKESLEQIKQDLDEADE